MALALSLQCALQTRYSLALAQFYMWAQTPHSVMLAVFIPTGRFTSARESSQSNPFATRHDEKVL